MYGGGVDRSTLQGYFGRNVGLELLGKTWGSTAGNRHSATHKNSYSILERGEVRVSVEP